MPVERVWALVSDPSRRPEWDPGTSLVTVTADGLERLTSSGGDLRRSSPGRGRGVQLSRPLLVRMMRTELRLVARAIAPST